MPTFDAVIVGKITLPEVSTGPLPPGQPPLGIWGGGNVPMPTPPIYIPIVPPNVVMPPIYIPVSPEHPIAVPPPGSEVPTHPIYYPPVVWPPQPPVSIWPSPGHPAHPIAPGGPPPTIWPSPGRPTHPIYVPIKPDRPPVDGQPEHPIYFPMYPEHPIAILPPVTGAPEHPIIIPPELPPENVTPEPGTPGFWGYSVYYSSPVFVPHIPSTGFPPPHVSTQPVPPGPEMPPAVPGRESRR